MLFNQQEFAIIRTDFSKGGIYFIEEGEEILLLDQKFELVDRIELKNALRPHGVRKYQDTWVLVSSYQDALIGVDDKGNEVFHYPLSHNKAKSSNPQHHYNDVEIVGDNVE